MLHAHSATIDKLCEHWAKSHSQVPLRNGVDKAVICSFEKLHSTQLPNDFSAYLQRVDGFVRDEDPNGWNDVCDEGFYFYPLLDMTEVSSLPGRYIFCHNALTLQDYAIELRAGQQNGEVSIVGDGALIHLAGSFTAFVQLYTADSHQLYSGTSAPSA